MKKVVLLAIFSFFLVAGSFAQKFAYPDTRGKAGFNLIESKSNGVQVFFSVPEFTMEDIMVEGQVMKNIYLPGSFLFNDEGMPNLPGTGKYIAVTQGCTPKLRIVSQQTEIIHNVEVAPAMRIPLDNEPDFPLKKNVEVYSRDMFYPASPVKMSELNKIRGVDVVILGFTPFQYNPVTKDLIVYKDIQVEIEFTGGNGHFGDDAYRSAWFDPIMNDNIFNNASLPVIDYGKRFQNYSKGAKDTECEYIIISPTGPDFLKWADSIANFRNQQGILTHIYTIDEIGGNNETSIESFIDNAYLTWTIKPAACLMLGDYGTDPTKNLTSHLYVHPAGYPNFASDNKFADVDNDEMPDVVFSRMTANDNTQLQTMCTKFLNYERTPPTDPSFYDKPITALGWQTERWFQLCSELVGGFWKNTMNKHPRRINKIYQGTPGSVWSTATNTNTVVSYFGPTGLGYIPSTPNEMPCCWNSGNATQINAAVDSGAFILQHRDHGDYTSWGEPAYNTGNINQLTNTLLPFVFSINCETGAYQRSGEVFGEKFHRHVANGHNAGALGVVCPSEVSYSFVNDTFLWGVYDNMWPTFMPAEGTTPESRGVLPAFGNAAGKYFLKQSTWPYNSGDKLVTYRLFHMFGDAFQVVYYDVPQPLTVTHDQIIPSTSTSFNITTNQDAMIALTVNNVIIGTGIGAGSTPVTITIPQQVSGTQVLVTVTKQNFYRYTAYVPVTSETIAANFSADVTLMCTDGAANFTDQSIGNPETWSWTFEGGNPGTSNVPNPSNIVYNTAGSYNVTLVITKTGLEPQTMTKNAYINVVNHPVAEYAATTSCIGSATEFTDQSQTNGSTITNWSWNFGEPASGTANTSTLPNPTHTYSAAGTYSVLLTITNNGNCTNAITKTIEVLDIPGSAAAPNGNSILCKGATGNVYTTDGANFATLYNWVVTPAEAGTFSTNTTTGTLDLNPDFSGTAIITVQGVNNCGNGAFSTGFDISVNLFPGAGSMPTGIDSVDLRTITTSDFVTTAIAEATSYTWMLAPSTAGSISGAGLTGTVTWTPSYRGIASISVKGLNDCGEGTVSDPKPVKVYSTVGISENDNLGISVFPNPTTGKFTFTITTGTKSALNIRIINTLGSLVMEENDVMVSGKYSKTLDLSTMPEGIYFFKVESDAGTFIRKIVLDK